MLDYLPGYAHHGHHQQHKEGDQDGGEEEKQKVGEQGILWRQ